MPGRAKDRMKTILTYKRKQRMCHLVYWWDQIKKVEPLGLLQNIIYVMVLDFWVGRSGRNRKCEPN